jgi:hypothetical protein
MSFIKLMSAVEEDTIAAIRAGMQRAKDQERSNLPSARATLNAIAANVYAMRKKARIERQQRGVPDEGDET